MPELPEVQSTVDYLIPRIKGLNIINSKFTWRNAILTHTPEVLQKLLSGKKIVEIRRRAKFIVLELCQDLKISYLLFHLRMSGSIEVVSSKLPRDPYDRCWLELNNGKELRFNDVRKFGKLYYLEDYEIFSSTLGIEPLSNNFDLNALRKILLASSCRIKTLLLDQKKIAGIGNIYADECLWRAGIHPATKAKMIPAAKIKLLHQAIVRILKEAIKLKGTDNGDEVVSGGMYQPKVYGRQNLPCRKCDKMIIKIFLAQRGTHFCKGCQKLSLPK